MKDISELSVRQEVVCERKERLSVGETETKLNNHCPRGWNRVVADIRLKYRYKF